MTKVTCILALVLAAAAFIADDARGFITLKDGTIVSGHLISIDDFQVTGVVDPDGDERTYKREDMTPGSWYMIRSQTAGNDAKARFALARYCVDTGLFGNAMEELKKVYDLDESMQKAAQDLYLKAQESSAQNLLQIAEHALERKNYKNAKRLASQIVTEYADTGAAERAAQIVEQLQADETATPTMEKQIHEPLTEAQVDQMKETDPRAVEARKYLERARDRNVKGLKDKSMSSAQQQFEGAIKDYEKVLEIAAKILEEEKDQPVIIKRVEEFQVTITDEMVETYVNCAGLLASRSSYPKAREVMNDCLTKFPGNQRARSYIQHIDTLAAMATGDRWNNKKLR